MFVALRMDTRHQYEEKLDTHKKQPCDPLVYGTRGHEWTTFVETVG